MTQKFDTQDASAMKKLGGRIKFVGRYLRESAKARTQIVVPKVMGALTTERWRQTRYTKEFAGQTELPDEESLSAQKHQSLSASLTRRYGPYKLHLSLNKIKKAQTLAPLFGYPVGSENGKKALTDVFGFFSERVAKLELEPVAKILPLFNRGRNQPMKQGPAARSSVFLAFVAQFLTGAVFLSNPNDPSSTYSSHHIDLSPLYGLNPSDTNILRSGEGGMMATWDNPDDPEGKEIFPDKICEPQEEGSSEKPVVKEKYKGLRWVGDDPERFLVNDKNPMAGQDLNDVFATGIPVANETVGNIALTTLFLREHNRICGELKKRKLYEKSEDYEGILENRKNMSDEAFLKTYNTIRNREYKKSARENPLKTPEEVMQWWEDEFYFTRAQKINVTQFMKVVLEDYINHIAGRKAFKLLPNLNLKKAMKWLKDPTLSFEFNMLYRWHSLIPNSFRILSGLKPKMPNADVAAADVKVAGSAENQTPEGTEDKALDLRGMVNNNKEFIETGMAGILVSASSQAAGTHALFNTHLGMLFVDGQTAKKSREVTDGTGRGLQSLNAYRKKFGLKRFESFEELNSDRETQKRLKETFGHIDDVPFEVGIYAEEPRRDKSDWLAKRGFPLMGDTMRHMVAQGALSHIFSSPLLDPVEFNKEKLTEYGWDLIMNQTRSFADIAARNMSEAEKERFGNNPLIGFQNPDYVEATIKERAMGYEDNEDALKAHRAKLELAA